MCGIIGYTGKNNAVPYLIKGLERLEYRGYDSAGIAVCRDGEISVTRRKGRLDVLKEAVSSLDGSGTGIGHTRWATHGAPSERNAHPHTSESGLFTIVHNGIIENHAALKQELSAEGVHFSSETDTEPIAHLLERNYSGDTVEAVVKTVSGLEGSFALGILCREHPDEIVCVRRASPLTAALCPDGGFIASDVTAVLEYTNEIYKLEDGDIAKITPSSISFFNSDGCEVQRQLEVIAWSIDLAEKGGYEHFMLKEIYEQPRAIRDTCSEHIKNSVVSPAGFTMTQQQAQRLENIYFVACGSAYHVGAAGKYIFEKTLKIPTQADVASEFRYRDPLLDEKCLVIIISQSGETADTLAALRLAKQKHARTLAIVNVLSSTIACESDDVLYTHAGPEIAVATTKAYSAQLAVVYMLAAHLGQLTGSLEQKEYDGLVDAIVKLPEMAEATLDSTAEQMRQISKSLYMSEDIYFIGRNLDYACAMEASLKLKEISYIHSEAIGAGELKHGTISLIEEETPVAALCCHEATFYKMMSNVREVTARGARVLCITDTEHARLTEDAKDIVTIPKTHPLLIISLEVIPMQLLSYYTAKLRGCDIDKPRNLAKSVTVE